MAAGKPWPAKSFHMVWGAPNPIPKGCFQCHSGGPFGTEAGGKLADSPWGEAALCNGARNLILSLWFSQRGGGKFIFQEEEGVHNRRAFSANLFVIVA